jgi:hypothetical protein
MKLPRVRAPFLAAGLSAVSAMRVYAACGGTTGRESGSPLISSVDAAISDSLDATVADGRDTLVMAIAQDAGILDPPSLDADEGLFDVIIPYADRALPDVQVPVDSGDAGGILWPNCPRDLGIDPNGKWTSDYNNSVAVVPAQFDQGGNAVAAPDGSACAVFPWLGRLDWTQCVRSNIASNDTSLPPCNALVDAGNALQGAGAGRPYFDLCKELADCIIRTSCGLTANVSPECLCGVGNASLACKRLNAPGPCRNEELAAMEINPNDPNAVDTAMANYFALADKQFAAAGPLNQLYALGASSNCFIAGDAAH